MRPLRRSKVNSAVLFTYQKSMSVQKLPSISCFLVLVLVVVVVVVVVVLPPPPPLTPLPPSISSILPATVPLTLVKHVTHSSPEVFVRLASR